MTVLLSIFSRPNSSRNLLENVPSMAIAQANQNVGADADEQTGWWYQAESRIDHIHTWSGCLRNKGRSRLQLSL